MPELFIKGTMGIMLLICAAQDSIQKKVCTWMIAIGAIMMGICVLFSHSITMLDRIGGLLVGAAVVIISKATGGKIGMGDGLLLCVTGIGLGLWGNLELFAVALFAAAIVSIILLSLRLVDRKKSIPFVPFLFIGYLFITFIPS